MRILFYLTVAIAGLFTTPAKAIQATSSEFGCSIQVILGYGSEIRLTRRDDATVLQATVPTNARSGGDVRYTAAIRASDGQQAALNVTLDPLSSRRAFALNGPLSAEVQRALRVGPSATVEISWGSTPAETTTVGLGSFSSAFAALDACRPLVPPPGRAAAPVGVPARWILSTLESQAEELKAAGVGLLRFEADLVISPLGQLATCAIAVSTGVALLDDRLCRAIRTRGRFVTATDAASRHIAGRYRLVLPPIRIQ